MVDLLSELWGELAGGGGKGVLEDLMDFLEGRGGDDDGKNGNGVMNGSRPRSSAGTTAAGGHQDEVRRKALQNLESHLRSLEREQRDLSARLRAETAAAAARIGGEGEEKDGGGEGGESLDDMERRLQALEDLKAIEARQGETKRQIRRLKRAGSESGSFSTRTSTGFSASASASSSSSSPPPPPSPSSSSSSSSTASASSHQRAAELRARDVRVNEELAALKRSMGLSNKAK